MNRTKYIPYCFDAKYEYRTYKKIGKYYKIDNFCEGLFYRLIRKMINVKNKNQKRYKKFGTYSEWKKYVINYLEKIDNKEDFLHFLKRCRGNFQMQIDAILSIALPIYICEISTMIAFVNSIYDTLKNSFDSNIILNEMIKSTFNNFAWCMGTILAIFFISIKLYDWCKKHYYFYRDWIEIVEELIKQERNESI